MHINCSICGHTNVNGGRFCEFCGKEMVEPLTCGMAPKLIVQIHELKEEYIKIEELKESVKAAREAGYTDGIKIKKALKVFFDPLHIIILLICLFGIAAIIEMQVTSLYQERDELFELYSAKAEEKERQEIDYLERFHYVEQIKLKKLEEGEWTKPIVEAYQSVLNRYLEFKVIVKSK